MKTKKIVSTLLIVIMTFLTPVSANIDSPPALVLNGNPVNVDVKLIDNKVYVQLETLLEAVGGNAKMNSQNNIIDVSIRNIDDIIPQVIEKVSPSVVGIIGTYKNENAEYERYSEKQFIHGTGAIIKENGEIITNTHVVEQMNKIIVVLADGNAYEAKLKAIDKPTDLAVITINKTGLKPVKFAQESKLRIGDTVIAIGTPISFSLRNSASMGIISGINRSIYSEYKLIQTDAAINPGNSGGPLVNLEGEIVGINTSKFIGEGIEGMGFSIPINTVKYVLEQFEKHGKVVRPYLGVRLEEDWISKVGLPSNTGIIIESIEAKSPASIQGLKPKDIILSINDVKINSIVDYNEEMKKYEPNSKANFKIKRNGVIQNLTITFSEKK